MILFMVMIVGFITIMCFPQADQMNDFSGFVHPPYHCAFDRQVD